MKQGDILLMNLRAYDLLFTLMVIEDTENQYELLGRIVIYHSN